MFSGRSGRPGATCHPKCHRFSLLRKVCPSLHATPDARGPNVMSWLRWKKHRENPYTASLSALPDPRCGAVWIAAMSPLYPAQFSTGGVSSFRGAIVLAGVSPLSAPTAPHSVLPVRGAGRACPSRKRAHRGARAATAGIKKCRTVKVRCFARHVENLGTNQRRPPPCQTDICPAGRLPAPR